MINAWSRTASVLLASAALTATGCSADKPADDPKFVAGQPLALESAHGLTSVTVTADGGKLEQGTNALLVVLGGADVELVSASSFMPVHGHPGPTPAVTRAGSAYRVTGLEFTMPGLWQVTLDLRAQSETDSADFVVDVP
ncbi:MAG TPA: hypothetical protein VHE30_28905 [Polyangiaceae bacterium]|nr:hypothetical protein [Polyangiaceae bacterium]